MEHVTMTWIGHEIRSVQTSRYQSTHFVDTLIHLLWALSGTGFPLCHPGGKWASKTSPSMSFPWLRQSIKPGVSIGCHISTAHWEVIRTMITSNWEKWRQAKKVLTCVRRAVPGFENVPRQHMYDGLSVSADRLLLLKPVVCRAVAGVNAAGGHVLLPSLAWGPGQVHSSCWSLLANNDAQHTPVRLSQLHQGRH